MEFTATSILSLLDTTAAERATFVNQIVFDVKYMGGNSEDIHRQLKCIEQIVADIKRSIPPAEPVLYQIHDNINKTSVVIHDSLIC